MAACVPVVQDVLPHLQDPGDTRQLPQLSDPRVQLRVLSAVLERREGEEGRKEIFLFNDALKMLNELISDTFIYCTALYTVFLIF